MANDALRSMLSTAEAMPPKPREKVLLCSADALAKLIAEAPIEVESHPTTSGVKVVVRQWLPENFATLVDACLLEVDGD